MYNRWGIRPDLREKIRIVKIGEDMNDVAEELLSDSNNTVVAALTDEKDLERLPGKVKALVFKGETGDFNHLDGIIAALRALQTRNVDSLLRIYSILTGEKFAGTGEDILSVIEEPLQLARLIVFNLKPIMVNDPEELRRINKLLLRFVRSV